jgi:IS5 family transposase
VGLGARAHGLRDRPCPPRTLRRRVPHREHASKRPRGSLRANSGPSKATPCKIRRNVLCSRAIHDWKGAPRANKSLELRLLETIDTELDDLRWRVGRHGRQFTRASLVRSSGRCFAIVPWRGSIQRAADCRACSPAREPSRRPPP